MKPLDFKTWLKVEVSQYRPTAPVVSSQFSIV